MEPKTKRAFKANKLRSDELLCDTARPKPRRSIPVKVLDAMIEREAARVKSERTLYDDRNALINHIADVESNLEYHESSAHDCEKTLIELKLQLNKTNTAIKRELDLDSLR